MTLFLKKVSEWCLDWVMPRYCYGCGVEGEWFCVECFENNIEFVDQQVCPDCRRKSDFGEMCEYCKSKWCLDGLIVCCEKNKMLGKLVSEYKYRDIYNLNDVLGTFYLQCIEDDIFQNVDIVAPVPLELRRLWWRGFNQTELIARKISIKSGVKYENVLKRKKFDKQQVGLPKNERFENVRGVFELAGNVAGKSVLLVDDVCTTMATMNECASVLKRGSVQRVTGVVLARGL